MTCKVNVSLEDANGANHDGEREYEVGETICIGGECMECKQTGWVVIGECEPDTKDGATCGEETGSDTAAAAKSSDPC